MKRKIVLLVLVLYASLGWSQDGRVLISEKISGKRIVLTAENTTQDTLNVFFMVISEGFRRSASKPMIKDLSPNSKTNMITLIELNDVPSNYTYELIINNDESTISMSYEKPPAAIGKVINGRIVLFSEPGCGKCEALDEALKTRRVEYRNFYFNDDPELYDQFLQFVRKIHPEVIKMKLPVIWNRDHIIFGYEELPKILNDLKIK